MIAVEQINKSYRVHGTYKRVLDDVSFTINRGQSIGILGQNGAGKSTLMRLITGVEYPDSGHIRREMSVSWPLGFGGGFQGSLTGADNTRFIARIYDMPVQEAFNFVKEFSELGDYFHMPVKTYSAGMVARLAFGISLAVEFDCYVIDEIIAVGDHRFTERCHKALEERRQRGALILASHQTSLLKKYCESGAVLHQGKLTLYGNLDHAIEAYNRLN
jgi:capsular polysaccharide transport system ATP-binding protein